MSSESASFVPYFSYRDGAAAIEFLMRAFGFELSQVHEGEGGEIMHAELRWGRAFLMLGTGEPPPEGDPAASSPAGHGVYVVVDDVDAHFERARDAGARIVHDPEDTEFGTRRYRALDSEGYEWSFGTYSPG